MTTTKRPPEFYCIGAGVFVPLRVADLLQRSTNLHRVATEARGADPEFDDVAAAIRRAAMAYRNQNGTRLEPRPEQPPPSEQWMTAREAADAIGIGCRAVRMAISRGRLKAERDGSRWRIQRAEVQRYRSRRAA